MKNTKPALLQAEFTKQIENGVFGLSGAYFLPLAQLAKEQHTSLRDVQTAVHGLREEALIETIGTRTYVTYGEVSPETPYAALRKKSGTVGILVPYTDSNMYAAYLDSVDKYLRKHMLRTAIILHNNMPDREREGLSYFKKINADGVIAFGRNVNARFYNRFPLPLVVVGECTNRIRIQTDGYGAGRRIAEYFSERDYSRFLFVCYGSIDDIHRRRLQGLYDAFAKRGPECSEESMVDIKDNPRRAVYRICAQTEKNVVIFLNLSYYQLFLKIVNECGFAVNKNTEVVFFRDINRNSQKYNGVTVVDWAVDTLATKSVELLLGQLRGEQEPHVQHYVSPHITWHAPNSE